MTQEEANKFFTEYLKSEECKYLIKVVKEFMKLDYPKNMWKVK